MIFALHFFFQIDVKKRGRVVTYLVAEDQGTDPVPSDLPSSVDMSEVTSNASVDGSFFVMPQQVRSSPMRNENPRQNQRDLTHMPLLFHLLLSFDLLQPSRPMGQASEGTAFGSNVTLVRQDAGGAAAEKLSWMEEQEKRIKAQEADLNAVAANATPAPAAQAAQAAQAAADVAPAPAAQATPVLDLDAGHQVVAPSAGVAGIPPVDTAAAAGAAAETGPRSAPKPRMKRMSFV